MKTSRVLGSLAAAAVLAVTAGVTAADRPQLDERQRQAITGPQLQPRIKAPPGGLRPANPCPQGWTLAGPVQPSGSFMCKPAKPRAVDCPPDTQWVDNGCAVGCQEILY